MVHALHSQGTTPTHLCALTASGSSVMTGSHVRCSDVRFELPTAPGEPQSFSSTREQTGRFSVPTSSSRFAWRSVLLRLRIHVAPILGPAFHRLRHGFPHSAVPFPSSLAVAGMGALLDVTNIDGWGPGFNARRITFLREILRWSDSGTRRLPGLSLPRRRGPRSKV